MSSSGLTRRPSNRDKNKPLPQLGPNSPQRAVNTESNAMSYNLVVCGATNPKEGFIFSDFMGYCFALMDRKIYGRFISCFPLGDHFAWLATRKDPRTDVKFGKMSNTERRSLVSYSREQYERREYWWEQIGKDQMRGEILSWIETKISEAKSGDVVNIIIECHGNSKGKGLRVGTHLIHPNEIAGQLAKFSNGVQVNVITGACHSGRIADIISASGQTNRHIAAACAANEVATAYTRSISNRLRNSRFSQAFCQSLARMKLPGVSQQPVIRLGPHEDWMRTMTSRSISPNHAGGLQSDTYTSYNEPNDITKLVEAMIFRDKADVVYEPAIAASRRRVEYPTINPEIIRRFKDWGPDRPYPFGNNVKQDLEELARAELSKCDVASPLGNDIVFVEDMMYSNQEPRYTEILKALYWRGRVQNAVFDTFSILCMRGYLDPNCLRLPLSMYQISNPVSELAWLLSCFEGPHREEHMDPEPFEFYSRDFSGPLVWLATMILRGCADIGNLFETITLCGFLGELNDEAFEHWKSYTTQKHFQINPQEGAVPQRGKNEFGFWLPHGLGNVDEDTFANRLRSELNTFNRIERIFRDWFQIPRTELWLESEQEEYFERLPHKMPGYKKSGDWTAAFNMEGMTQSLGGGSPMASSSGSGGKSPDTTITTPERRK